jgi:TRAP-type C4-dicarboxylate transport system permease small subunit
LALPDAEGAWVALALARGGGVALTGPRSDLVVGLIAGIAVLPSVEGFLAAQIPGFIALSLTFALAVNFLGSHLASILGGLVGGGMLLWYFLEKAGPQYDWTSGLTAILLLYVGFLGASMATHDGRHISVDAVRKLFKSHHFHLYNAIGEIVSLLFTGFLGVMAVRYLLHMKVGGDYHAASDLSAWIAVVPIGFGFTMMVVRWAIRIAAALKSWRRREPAPELAPDLV